MKPHDAKWVSSYPTYATCYYSATVAFNVVTTATICLRLYMMRRKVEAVLGRIGASLYTSPSTKFVESGALFTFWSIVYLILRTRGSFAQDVFLYPYIHILVRIRFRYSGSRYTDSSTAGHHTNVNNFSNGPRSGLVRGHCDGVCSGSHGLAGVIDT